MKLLNLTLKIVVVLTMLSCSSDDTTNVDNSVDPENNENPLDPGNNENSSDPETKLIKEITVFKNGNPQSALSFEYSDGVLISLIEVFDTRTVYNYVNNALEYEQKLKYDVDSESYTTEYERTEFIYQDNLLVSDLVTENESPIQKHDYELNSNGKMDKYDFYNYFNNQYNSAGSRLFVYSASNITEETQTDNNAETVFKHQYTYDDQNHPLINVDIQIRRQLWSYPLNSMNENNIITYATYDGNGNLQSSYSYTYLYDSNGYPTQREKRETNSDELIETVTYEYF